MLLGGIGSGMFPLTLTMIGLRSRQVVVTASLAAFTQGVGYLLAGSGPLLVGLLLDLTGEDWTWPLVLLLVADVLSFVFGWYAAHPRYVEDELNMPVSQA
jgi:CP family cyanate transporter-like MFS transporter